MLPALSKREKDKVRIFLHQIYKVRQLEKDNRSDDPYYTIGYVSLNFKILREINDNIKPTIDLLKEHKIIEVLLNVDGRETFSNGLKPTSKKYRINPSLTRPKNYKSGDRMYKKEYVTYKNIIKNILKHEQKNLIDIDDIYKPIIDTTKKLRADILKGRAILDNLLQWGQIDPETYEITLNNLEDFNSEPARYKVCDYLRHHHRLTNLKKEARACIYIEGKKFAKYKMTDVKNSQMFILASLFNPKFREYFKDDINNEILKHLSAIQVSKNIEKFCKDAITGKLWDKMQKELNKSRGEVKTKTLTLLYGDAQLLTNDSFRSIYSDYFNEHYPSVVNFIVQAKQINYKHLSQTLQRVEARCYYDLIAVNMIQDTNGFDEFSLIHDSFFYADEILKNGLRKSAYVEKMICESFEKLGFATPKLKTGRVDE